MEKEFTDPGPYYYSGSGQFYSPQFVRSLSEAGQTSSQASCSGPAGNAIPLPSGSSGGLSAQSLGNDSQQALQVGGDTYLVASAILGPESPPALVLGVVAASVDFLVNFFEDIFGGGDTPPTPRKLLHGRHPLYPIILGLPEGEVPDEVSAGQPQTSAQSQVDSSASGGEIPLVETSFIVPTPPLKKPTQPGPFDIPRLPKHSTPPRFIPGPPYYPNPNDPFDRPYPIPLPQPPRPDKFTPQRRHVCF